MTEDFVRLYASITQSIVLDSINIEFQSSKFVMSFEIITCSSQSLRTDNALAISKEYTGPAPVCPNDTSEILITFLFSFLDNDKVIRQMGMLSTPTIYLHL